jgi:hypothetical protein
VIWRGRAHNGIVLHVIEGLEGRDPDLAQDGVLDMAAEDADADGIMAAMLLEAEKARSTPMAVAPTLEEFMQMLAA